MKVLIACEFSGIVRDAFTRRGHIATSIDLLDSEYPNPGLPAHHIVGDVVPYLHKINQMATVPYDLLIAHPPCTHLAVSGARWFKDKEIEQRAAIKFFMEFVYCKIPRICIENPVSIMSTQYRKPDQIIQPWQFGHGETKATCLWLKNLPPLVPTKIVDGREARVHKERPGPDRWKNRSRTYTGIAEAMASQWGALL